MTGTLVPDWGLIGIVYGAGIVVSALGLTVFTAYDDPNEDPKKVTVPIVIVSAGWGIFFPLLLLFLACRYVLTSPFRLAWSLGVWLKLHPIRDMIDDWKGYGHE